jgi:hypothetical protein
MRGLPPRGRVEQTVVIRAAEAEVIEKAAAEFTIERTGNKLTTEINEKRAAADAKALRRDGRHLLGELFRHLEAWIALFRDSVCIGADAEQIRVMSLVEPLLRDIDIPTGSVVASSKRKSSVDVAGEN